MQNNLARLNCEQRILDTKRQILLDPDIPHLTKRYKICQCELKENIAMVKQTLANPVSEHDSIDKLEGLKFERLCDATDGPKLRIFTIDKDSNKQRYVDNHYIPLQLYIGEDKEWDEEWKNAPAVWSLLKENGWHLIEFWHKGLNVDVQIYQQPPVRFFERVTTSGAEESVDYFYDIADVLRFVTHKVRTYRFLFPHTTATNLADKTEVKKLHELSVSM